MLGITRRRAAATAAAAGLVGGLLGWAGPSPAQADHCQPMYVYSGHSAADTGGPRVNTSSGGCLFVNQQDENLNTKFLLPGANAFSVGVYPDPAGVERPTGEETATVEAGTVTYTFSGADGSAETVTEPMSLTWNGTRWNSQTIVVDGLLERVTAEVDTQPGVNVTTTYRSIGEDA